jgi:FkbM family methyltransferase
MEKRAMTAAEAIPNLYPSRNNPYYIVAPRYVRTSAGVKALYLLCHWLNRVGESAFIYTWPQNIEATGNPDLLTPSVTRPVIDQHVGQGRTPIFIYTDVVNENIANADVVVRYFGHYPGHLAPHAKLAHEELHFSHSLQIAEKTDAPDNVLYIPVCDPSVFHPAQEPSARKGTCYYAAKYKNLHGQDIFGIPADSFEITRDTNGDLTPEQLAELFQRSECVYLFEDSAIGNEATMCGCPVVLVPNDFFEMPVGFNEVGRDGIAWGLDAAEIERAKNSVSLSFRNYVKLISDFPKMLDTFIEKTQEFARTRRQAGMVIAPEENYYLLKSSRTYLPSAVHLKNRRLKRRFEILPFIGPHLRRVRKLRESMGVMRETLRSLDETALNLRLQNAYLKSMGAMHETLRTLDETALNLRLQNAYLKGIAVAERLPTELENDVSAGVHALPPVKELGQTSQGEAVIAEAPNQLTSQEPLDLKRKIQLFLANLPPLAASGGRQIDIVYPGDEKAIEVIDGRRKIKISPRHFFYAPDLVVRFDEYFEASEADSVGEWSIVDLSEPGWRKSKFFDGELFFTSLPEGDDESEMYMRWLAPQRGETVLDFGAYCGLSTLVLGAAVGPEGKVFAFEPDPENFAALQKNLARYSASQIQAFPIAVAGHSGTACFSGEANMGSRIISDPALNRDRLTEVQTLRFEEILARLDLADVDIVKMDIESAEYEVVESCREFLKQSGSRWLIEAHSDPITSAHADTARLRRIFDEAGYSSSIVKTYIGHGTDLVYASRAAPLRSMADREEEGSPPYESASNKSRQI